MANGLLDFLQTPAGQGLLAATFGGLAGARRGEPINSLGRAGLAGLSGYAGAQDRQITQENAAAMRDFRNAQMQAVQMERDRMQAEMERQTQRRQLLPQLYETPTTQPQVSVNQMGLPQVDQAAVVTGPRQFNVDRAIQSGLFTPQEIETYRKLGMPEEYTLTPGSARFRGTQQIAAAPKETSPPSSFQEFMLAQQNPAFAEYQQRLKRAGAPQTMVNIGQEKAEAQVVGKAFGEQYSDIQKAGFSAQSTINRYDRLNQLLEGVQTGKFTPLGVELAKGAKAFGFDIDPNLPNKEAAVALSNEVALQLRNPAGGAGMPGAMSDKDREFLVSMTPGLATTQEGRKMMIETAKKLAKRDMDVARIARDYRKRKGSLDEGFYDELADYANKNPLFPAVQATQTPVAGPFSDPAKEKRYQQWLRSQGR